MYEWLEKYPETDYEKDFKIEEFIAKRWKNPYDLKRKYTILTQFLCMAAFDEEQSTTLYISLEAQPEKELVEEVLLHFKDVKILSHEEKPFELMLQNVRASSISIVLKKGLHPIVEDLFGRTPRMIDEDWFPNRGIFTVQKNCLERYVDPEFKKVLKILSKYKLTSFSTNFLLNEKYKNSHALRFLSYETTDLILKVNENNHITQITFEL